ncbi:hypothetical protein O6H91_22G066300 [Diphasiastrum complanatum]|uniref:Uncharacterized protein n=2 Tax=Diphasiastrum complanatum TaxID=34168 RepID=A0ACC2AI68_DIPCM|nr:hypothetical protein O6H91_22G066300 [Diphasiastrum complanatum]KAJ7516655.1 hypothetical protein O6H91_22G066300 [Diphasiastrum complanatum]
MGSSSDLSLGCRTRQVALAGAFKTFMLMEDQLEHMQKLEGFLKSLEEERAKIEAFKRELPFCMQLLNDAIEASKQHLSEYQSDSPTVCRSDLGRQYVESESNCHSLCGKPVLEEFIPLKSKYEKLNKDDGEEQPLKSFHRYLDRDKPGWMTQAQLWSQHSKSVDFRQEKLMAGKEEQEELDNLCVEAKSRLLPCSNLSFNPKQGSCGAFSPFVRTKHSVSVSEAEANMPFPLRNHEDCQRSPSSLQHEEQAHNVSMERVEGHEHMVLARETGTCAASGTCSISGNGSTHVTGQPQRKARRCWSPELHRRFVNALQQLGGPQVATPKQIRDLMKVEGLTNDEVKSHLQKYRLHTRRPSPVLQAADTPSPQLVVLGGIWVSPEYAAATVVQQNPGIYDQTSQEQLAKCSPSPTEYFPYLNPSTNQMQLHHTVFSQHQQSPSNSNITPQWQRNSASQVLMAPQGSNENHEKAGSDGDDVLSDNTGSRGGNAGRDRKNCGESMACKSSGRDFNAGEQHEEYDDGDVTEAEDSRGSERTLELQICEKELCCDGL